MNRRSLLGWAFVTLALVPAEAWADGGTVCFAGRAGPYRLTVFSLPTPLRAGLADFSVLVEDAGTDEPVPSASVILALSSVDHAGATAYYPATAAAATNKFLKAASVNLPHPGTWRITVQIDGDRGRSQATFLVDAADRLPRAVEMSFWFLWPVGLVILFGIREYVVWSTRPAGPH